jgi:poly(3-hydroxybutyrate) depolymerase
MTSRRRSWIVLTLAAQAVAVVSAGPPASAQATNAGATLEESAPPGNNYDKAEFRLWIPPNADRLRGALVLVPGSNGDGRPMAEDSVWRAFATRHAFALVGCRFTDKPHEQGFIEEYIRVADGSGPALLDALRRFGTTSHHPELSDAPLLLWGMSAGGEFDYEFVAWKPERVIAFVVNKGGIYYTALTPRAARSVPGLLFIGEKDLDSRRNTISGLFAVNRRGGALWALVDEPNAAHVVGRSRDMSVIFFDDVLGLRLPGLSGDETSVHLRSLDEKTGFLGDLKTKSFQSPGSAVAPNSLTAWLPTERAARAWRAVLTETPFDP